MSTASLTCQQATELVTEALERALSPRLHALFNEHVETCEPCSTYLQQVRETVAFLRSLPRERNEAEDPVSESLLEAFRQRRRHRT